MIQIELRGEYITLGQFLKIADFISSGGQAKIFLEEAIVLVNGEPENRRGRKLKHGDIIKVDDSEEIQLIEE